MGAVPRAPKNNYNKHTRHYQSQFTIRNITKIKKFEILQQLPNVTETQSEQVLLKKVGPIDLLNAELPHTINSYKMQYLQSTIKWGMPVITNACCHALKCTFHTSSFLWLSCLLLPRDSLCFALRRRTGVLKYYSLCTLISSCFHWGLFLSKSHRISNSQNK